MYYINLSHNSLDHKHKRYCERLKGHTHAAVLKKTRRQLMQFDPYRTPSLSHHSVKSDNTDMIQTVLDSM